jgi:hypothetical protein
MLSMRNALATKMTAADCSISLCHKPCIIPDQHYQFGERFSMNARTPS